MKVKICGITHPEDALFAAQQGADYIGIIFSKQSKRSVSLRLAKEIYSAIQSQPTELVGVFVDESAEEIVAICDELNIHTVQLHGEKSQHPLPYLFNYYNVFYALSPNKILPSLHKDILLLFDNPQPGSGECFDWHSFTQPQRAWILAGGLNKDNVATAIELLNPTIVDVASGVEYNNSIRKNPELVKEFIHVAKRG